MELILLKNRTIITLSGSDRIKFLQGLITNNANKINDQSLLYSLFLNHKGRFLYEVFIFEYNDTFFIDCEKNYVDLLLQHLKRYQLRSQVNFEHQNNWNIYSNIQADFIKVSDDNFVFSDPRNANLGYRLYTKKKFNSVSEMDNYIIARISLGVPDGSDDMVYEKSIPLENNMQELHAIDWQKGCYMGQEFTARTQYLGQIRKRIMPIYSKNYEFQGNEIINQNDKEVGKVYSFFKNQALALIRLEALNINKPLMCNECEVFQKGTIQTIGTVD